MKTIYEKTYIALSLATKAAVKEFGADWEDTHSIEEDEPCKFTVVKLDEDEDEDYEDEEGAAPEDDEEIENPRDMSKMLRKYRASYVKTLSSSANISADNGDDIAEMLRGLTPVVACGLADLVTQVEMGTHQAKYAHLNVGQQRMCAGNIVRAKVKGGEMTAKDVAEILKAYV